jgi:high-affinity nickel permease
LHFKGGSLGTIGNSLVLLLATSWLLGFRHGIDWDHIAAVTDIVSGQPRPWRAIQYGSMYALGHSVTIFAVGLVAIVLGLSLPPWVDAIMEHVVGFTLLLLGIWVLGTVVREGKTFRLRSRWMLFIEALKRGLAWFRRTEHHRHDSHEHTPYGGRSCFVLGLLHGAGAETPTQVILFAISLGVVTGVFSSIVGVLFLLGQSALLPAILGG